MFKNKLNLFHLFFFFFIFFLHQIIFLDYFPNQNNKLGHDFEQFLPNFVFGKIWFKNNFLNIPWFSPSFCCGTPFYPDPQTAFYSIQQIFYFLFNPILATKILFSYFSFLGFCGMYFLLRKNFNISFIFSLLGATLFIFNGFFIYRSIIGHIAYINFSLIPIYCFFLIESFTNKNSYIQKISLLLSALIFSSFFYSGAGPIMPLIIVSIISINLIYYLKIDNFKLVLVSTTKSIIFGLLISISKISASLFYLNNFKRNISPMYFENPFEYLNVVFKSLFFFPDLEYFNKTVVNTSITNFGIQEVEYGVTFIPLMVLLIFLFNFKKFFKIKNFNKILLFSFGIFLFPIILNTNILNFQSFWSSLPVFGSSWVQIRWSAIYIIPLIFFTVIILEKFKFNKYKIFVSIALFFIIFFQNTYRDKSFYDNQLYDPIDLVKFSKKLNEPNLEKNSLIKGYAAVVDKDDQIILNNLKRNDYFTMNFSSAYCYQPLFGYDLENLPKNNILFNRKIKLTPERYLIVGELKKSNDNKKYNFFNPSCFLFPSENNCLPGDLFDKKEKENLQNFLSYKKFNFKKNNIQNISDYLSLFSFLIIITMLLRNLYLYKKKPE